MRKVSELIELAMNHPMYFGDLADTGRKYRLGDVMVSHQNCLCYVLSDMACHGVITRREERSTKNPIYDSIEDHAFLHTHLVMTGVIKSHDYRNVKHREASMLHWAKLVEELKSQGK